MGGNVPSNYKIGDKVQLYNNNYIEFTDNNGDGILEMSLFDCTDKKLKEIKDINFKKNNNSKSIFEVHVKGTSDAVVIKSKNNNDEIPKDFKQLANNFRDINNTQPLEVLTGTKDQVTVKPKLSIDNSPNTKKAIAEIKDFEGGQINLDILGGIKI